MTVVIQSKGDGDAEFGAIGERLNDEGRERNGGRDCVAVWSRDQDLAVLHGLNLLNFWGSDFELLSARHIREVKHLSLMGIVAASALADTDFGPGLPSLAGSMSLGLMRQVQKELEPGHSIDFPRMLCDLGRLLQAANQSGFLRAAPRRYIKKAEEAQRRGLGQVAQWLF